MKPVITVQNIGVKYKRRGSVFKKKKYFQALKSISFELYKGETLGVVGRNGSGKSTLLRIIMGVCKPSSGVVVNHGVTVSLLSLQAGFDLNLNGRDNAIIGGMMQGHTRKEVESKLDEIHAYTELEDFFFEPVRTYSTGMVTRLGFAVSTIMSTDVLLLDEVLSVGDQQFKVKAEKTMNEKIHSDQTVIFVSHSEQQIIKLCNRALLIENGEGVVGKPDEIISAYTK